MALSEAYNKGIPKASGFSITSNSLVDPRCIRETLADLTNYKNDKAEKVDGLHVFVKSEQRFYAYFGGTWIPQAKLSDVTPKLSFEKVDSLDDVDEPETNKIYLVKELQGFKYQQWIFGVTDGGLKMWTNLGSTDINLADYQQKSTLKETIKEMLTAGDAIEITDDPEDSKKIKISSVGGAFGGGNLRVNEDMELIFTPNESGATKGTFELDQETGVLTYKSY